MENKNVWKTLIGFLLPLLLLAQIENWVYTYNGTANSDDGARAIVCGEDGNIYAVGQTLAQSYPSGNPEFTVISLMPVGDTNWVFRYNGPWGYDVATSIVYGTDSNIYAAGCSDNLGYATDLVAIKLNASGTANWVYRFYGNPSTGAIAITYGDDDNIYVAGWNMIGQYHCNFLVISLMATGDTNWIYEYGEPGDVNCAYSIVYGGDGNIYAAGNGTSSDTTDDFLVISLTTAGDTNWVYTYNGPSNCADAAQSVVYGGDGNIYAAGYSNSTGFSDGDFLVISLTTAGDTNWVYTYNGPSNHADVARSVVYGGDGNIYAAGHGNCLWPDESDFAVVSLRTTGDTNWIYTYNGPGNGRNEASSIVYSADSNIYIAGSSTGYGTGTDFTVISLSPGTGVEEGDQITCCDYEFRTTIFSGPLPLPTDKKCKIFDITGRVVEPDKIQPGIYFIEVDGVVTQKVVKVR